MRRTHLNSAQMVHISETEFKLFSFSNSIPQDPEGFHIDSEHCLQWALVNAVSVFKGVPCNSVHSLTTSTVLDSSHILVGMSCDTVHDLKLNGAITFCIWICSKEMQKVCQSILTIHSNTFNSEHILEENPFNACCPEVHKTHDPPHSRYSPDSPDSPDARDYSQNRNKVHFGSLTHVLSVL